MTCNLSEEIPNFRDIVTFQGMAETVIHQDIVGAVNSGTVFQEEQRYVWARLYEIRARIADLFDGVLPST